MLSFLPKQSDMALAQSSIILSCLYLVSSLFHEDEAQRVDWNSDGDGVRTLDSILHDSSARKLHFELPSAHQREQEFLQFPSLNKDPLGTGDFDIPAGYKFKPREEELVLHYLGNYIMGLPLPHSTIREIQLYNYDPDELPIGKSRRFLKNQLYFSTRNEAAYAHERVPRLATPTGFWKSNGNDEEVSVEELVVGFKRRYIFYRGEEDEAEKTPWIMHEYRINPEIIPEAIRTKINTDLKSEEVEEVKK